MKDAVLFSITKVVDDDTGIYDEYDFAVTDFGVRHGQSMSPEAVEQMRKMVEAAIRAMTKNYLQSEPQP